jgi:hypothetical protein
MELLRPPADYIKKIVNPDGSCPLTETFTPEQVEKRIAFYAELNQKRRRLERIASGGAERDRADRQTGGDLDGFASIPAEGQDCPGPKEGREVPADDIFRPVHRHFLLLGWEDTTTVRGYMRETVSKIIENLFFSRYELKVENVKTDKDHGHVEVQCRASALELKALAEYIRPGASYFVYDGEESKYVPGDTGASEFIIARPDAPLQPEKFWRRSRSFIAGIYTVPAPADGETM